MTSLSSQFEQLKELLAQLEESAIEHPVDSVAAVLEALEVAAEIQMYEGEAISLLLQTSANLMERLKDQDLSTPELQLLIRKLREVGYTDPEIKLLLALEMLHPDPMSP